MGLIWLSQPCAWRVAACASDPHFIGDCGGEAGRWRRGQRPQVGEDELGEHRGDGGDGVASRILLGILFDRPSSSCSFLAVGDERERQRERERSAIVEYG